MLSILSGKFKGQKLDVPKSGTRPTSSLVKKAMFDSLRPFLDDMVICDLFAGSGAIGLEGLSQGAKFCYFVEASKNAFSILKKNCEKLKVLDQVKLDLSKASSFLKKNSSNLVNIDLFYIDPPYEITKDDSSSYEHLIEFFKDANLKETSWLIFETKDELRIEKPLALQEALVIDQKKTYGDTFLYFVRKT